MDEVELKIALLKFISFYLFSDFHHVSSFKNIYVYIMFLYMYAYTHNIYVYVCVYVYMCVCTWVSVLKINLL